MQDLNDKVTGSTLTATEWNEVPSELQNVIQALGITLSASDLNQLGKAIAGYVANGNYYTDSGIADAYVLSVVGSKQRAPSYTNGMMVSFIAANANTGASTVNVASLGVKDIKGTGGEDPAAGDINGMVQLVFNSSSDRFELVNPKTNVIRQFEFIQSAKDSDSLVDHIGKYIQVAEYTAGNPINSTYKVKSGHATDDGVGIHNSTTGTLFHLELVPDTGLDVAVAGVSSVIVDNSPRIQAAIDYLESQGGGILTSSSADRYPCQGVIDMKAGVTWEKTKLTADITGNPDYFIGAQGSLGTSTLITANVDAGSVTVDVTSAAGFTIGEYALLKDPTRLNGRWPYTVARIENIVSNTLTLEQPVGVDYLLANSCTVEPMTAIEDVYLRDLDIEYSASGTSKFTIHLENAADSGIENCTVKEHAYTSNPTAAVTMRGDNLLNCELQKADITQNLNTNGGNSVLWFGTTDCRIENVVSKATNFGIGIWNSYGAFVSDNQVAGKAASGNRGIKMAACQNCRMSNNTINKFDSGIKIEDSGMFVVIGNTVSNCGLGSSHGINISHIEAPSSADIRPSVVQGNNVFNIDGSGFNLDLNTRQCTLDGNTTRQTTGAGIICQGPNNLISNNFIFDWQSDAGIRFVGTCTVVGNQLVGLNGALDSFELNATPGDTDWTVFNNNTCQSNGITTNLAFFEKVAVINGNAILDFGNRIMFASAAPISGTFTRGDKVYDNSPSASGNIGFVCVASGTPGTWKSFGNISA